MAKGQKKRTECGSILIYILIAVALFAALGFAVSNMMRGSGNIGTEKDGILASEILSYGRSLREALQAIKISNSCGDEQISFERSPFDGTDPDYANSATGSGYGCYIFHPEGGGVGYQENFGGKSWRFSSSYGLKGVGTDAQDLVAAIHVSREVCEMINQRVGGSNEAVKKGERINDGADANNMLPSFKGEYTSSVQILSSFYEGKMIGCYLAENSNGKEFTAYQVLISR